MNPQQLIARLSELKAEGNAIMQQLVASGISPEEIMAAVEGGGAAPPMPPPGIGGAGMGGGAGGFAGPDLPPGIPQGNPMGGGGMPPGLLGP